MTMTSEMNFLKSFSYQFSNEFYTSSILQWFSQYYSLTTDSTKIPSVFDLSLFAVILSEYLD